MSIVDNHFPQVTWRNREKRLWNPIGKQTLKNRPEERIRLRVIEYLLQSGWSKYRISTEENTADQKSNLRTDIICYTQAFDPFLLVECKAQKVNISETTAEQIARYNNQIKAPYLLLTNGRTDLWYAFGDEKKPALQKEIPEPFSNNNELKKKQFSYWTERGFGGSQSAPVVRSWVTDVLNTFSTCTDQSGITYLSFKKKLYDTDLNHYYCIHSFSDRRIALTLIDTAYGGTRLIAITNKEGENIGVLEINLDLLLDDRTLNASVYTREGRKNIDIQKKLDWNKNSFRFNSFAKQVNDWFKG